MNKKIAYLTSIATLSASAFLSSCATPAPVYRDYAQEASADMLTAVYLALEKTSIEEKKTYWGATSYRLHHPKNTDAAFLDEVLYRYHTHNFTWPKNVPYSAAQEEKRAKVEEKMEELLVKGFLKEEYEPAFLQRAQEAAKERKVQSSTRYNNTNTF